MDENEMELEEAIKFLENMNNTIKENKLLFDENNIQVRLGKSTSEAIETILQTLENKQKDIKNYEQMYDEDEKKIRNLQWKNEIYVKSIKSHKEALENSIPKKKIEDKIEELKNIESKTCKKIFNSQRTYWTEVIEDILQELLEDK